jgi:YVTN family beta-propeller protein
MRGPRPVILALGGLLVVSMVLVATPAPARAGVPPAVVAGVEGTAGVAPVSPAVSPLVDPLWPVEIPVGIAPDGVLVDTANDSAFVASQDLNLVTQIDLSNNQVVATYPVGSRPYPQAMALDLSNSTVYVANEASNNVSAISVNQTFVSAAIPVGPSPDAIAYNPANNLVYVADYGSAQVTLISAAWNRVVATVAVQSDPDAIAVDTVTHDVFVADAGTDNVSVLSGVSNTVIGTALVGVDPGADGAMVFNPTDGDVFVANPGSGNVSVISGTNHTAFASIPVGLGPSALAVDTSNKELFVANEYSNNVSVIATSNLTVLGSIPVGSDPGTDGALAVNSKAGTLYVPNWGSNNVSVVSASAHTVLTSIPVLAGPDAVAINSATSEVYVVDQGAGNVTVFQTTAVTLQESGLPNGRTWSVTASSPSVSFSNTTARSRGTIGLQVLSGTMSYAITPPAGYGVASVTGTGAPTQTSANVTGAPLTLTVRFGALEKLTFRALGEPPGSLWGIVLTAAAPHGGPPPQSNTTHGSSTNFTVVRDSWKFLVTPTPGLYRASPARGVVAVAAAPVTRTIRFILPTVEVLFREFDLAPGTLWRVNITGPMDVSLASTTASMKTFLENGSYTFTVTNFSGLHPHPSSGSFHLSSPHAPIVEVITYTSQAGVGGPREAPLPSAVLFPLDEGAHGIRALAGRLPG